MRRLFFVCTSVILCGVATAQVQIIKGGADKTPINLTGLSISGGQSVLYKKTLENDLKLSGWFTIVERGGVSVGGSCSTAGGRLSSEIRVAHESAGRSFLRQRYDGALSDVRQLAHKTADDIVKAVCGKPGIASTKIVMIGVRGGKRDIYICDADGGNLRQITHDGAVCASPNWIPGRNSFIYTSYYEGLPFVYYVDLASESRRCISRFPGLNAGAKASPDGKRIALTLSMHGNPDIYVMDIGGGKPTRVTATQSAVEASPAWSPDGRQLVYVSDIPGTPQLYVVDRSGGTPKRITFVGTQNVSPDWGADGKIAWTSRRGGRYEVCVADTPGGRENQLPGDGSDWEDPSWAPDGRHIVCTRTSGYHSDVYIIDIMGDPPLRLTAAAGEWYSPAWSK